MSIPIIGAAKGSVICWTPTAVVACRCRGENQVAVLMVTGFGNPVICPHCHYLYMNHGMQEVEPGQWAVVLRAIPPTPEGQVM